MKVVVTGSNGFIGKALVKELLQTGYEVCVLVRSASNTKPANVKAISYQYSLLECANELRNWQPAVFFHLAWRGVNNSNRNSEENNQYNYQLTIDSVQLAKETACKQWVGCGSQAEYGVQNKKLSEQDVCNPITEYGVTKQNLFKETKQLCYNYNITHTWARIFSVYGPLDHEATFVSYLVNNMLHQKDVQVSSCTQQWDYLFVDDAATALRSLIHHEGVYNIASGTTVVLKEVVATIAQLTDYNGSVQWNQKSDGQLHYLCGSIDKISNTTGWSPSISLKDGLAQTITCHQTTA